MTSHGKRKVIEAWMGFVNGRPRVYTPDEDGKMVFDFFTRKKDAKRHFDDVRPVRIEWNQEPMRGALDE